MSLFTKKFLILLFFLNSCGEHKKEKKIFSQNTSFSLFKKKDANLIFTAVDFEYKSSSLYKLNLNNGILEEKLSGQSGDPFLMKADEKVFLFNRSSYFHGLISFSNLSFSLAEAKFFSFDFENGDPIKVLEISKDFFLLVYFNKQTLRLFDFKKKVIIS